MMYPAGGWVKGSHKMEQGHKMNKSRRIETKQVPGIPGSNQALRGGRVNGVRLGAGVLVLLLTKKGPLDMNEYMASTF